MVLLFSFFLRLFLCFLSAKLVLLAFEAPGRGYLLGLTALFLANVYGLDYLSQRGRLPARRGEKEHQSLEPPGEVTGATDSQGTSQGQGPND